jgi:hypothetical protein
MAQHKVFQLGDLEGVFEAVNFQIYREGHGWVIVGGLLRLDGFTRPGPVDLSRVLYDVYYGSGSRFETEADALTVIDQLEA